MGNKVSGLDQVYVLPNKIVAHFQFVFRMGAPKWMFVRAGSISEFRTHKYHEIAQKFGTNPMGPAPGSETQISRTPKNDLVNSCSIVGVRIIVLEVFPLPVFSLGTCKAKPGHASTMPIYSNAMDRPGCRLLNGGWRTLTHSSFF